MGFRFRPGARRRRFEATGIIVASVVLGALGCSTSQTPSHTAELPRGSAATADTPPEQAAQASSCAARLPAPASLPRTPEALQDPDYWLSLYGDAADRRLLTSDEVRAHNAAARYEPDGERRIVDLSTPASPERVRETLEERAAFIAQRLEEGRYVAEDDEALAQVRAVDTFEPQGALHVVTAPLQLRCAPYLGRLTSTEGDGRHDRNNCSQARPGELLEVLGRVGEARFVRTAFSVGFVGEDASLSPAVEGAERRRWLRGPRVRLDAPLELDEGLRYPAGAVLPKRGSDEVRVATDEGFRDVRAQVSSLGGGLTRRALLTEAFRYLDEPYGWGGQDGGRDCSRFVMDVFRGVGLDLPRASGSQSLAGTFHVDVPEEASEADRLALLDEAHARGVVLIRFPGHIMLYLGRDRSGVPRAIHSFAEYLEPCAEGGETLYEVDRVSVSDLRLGEGSSRRSFLERITRLTVFGEGPGYALQALAAHRPSPAPPPAPPARCDDSMDVAMFRSPRKPVVGEPMRAIVASQDDTRPAKLYLVDPAGQRHAPETIELGVGPHGRVAAFTPRRYGRWTMLLADGPNVVACEHFGVASARETEESERTDEDPAWEAHFRWERDMEALYAVFVEQLFSHPVDDSRTWHGLTPLLRDPERNILINHLGLDEDTRMEMRPDCADLPYYLRAYFAWKTSLPFAFRRCRRGRAGRPPRCDGAITSDAPTPGEDSVAAFQRFVRRSVRRGVHSASNRTLPDDPRTDMYPLPLEREALKPGAVFNDPYGHIIVVAKWVPQGLDGTGMLLGADAQPDATVGRRRFWRGSFLFTPSTENVGAGFKAFRPLGREEPDAPLEVYDAQMLADSPHHYAPSKEQYEGTARDFYRRMDALIYPRPLPPSQRIRMLVDALEEQVVRRVSSVDNGEQWVKRHGATMEMPSGYAIFQTSGPWEDYATPSRDMRMLIAIDTVAGLPRLVAEAPERFGFPAGEGDKAAAEVEAQLHEELASRSFEYTGSDGEPVRLTLRDVLDRQKALEMAYNPNDCMEIRWGAPPGSAEMRQCERHAPEAQREKMREYRDWFATRTRPPRP